MYHIGPTGDAFIAGTATGMGMKVGVEIWLFLELSVLCGEPAGAIGANIFCASGQMCISINGEGGLVKCTTFSFEVSESDVCVTDVSFLLVILLSFEHCSLSDTRSDMSFSFCSSVSDNPCCCSSVTGQTGPFFPSLAGVEWILLKG